MDLRGFIVQWNNDNPLDRRFREKYHIAFNSPQHREINQLDILLEYIEDQVFEDHKQNIEERIKKQELFKKGIWISEREMPIEDEDALFNDIDIFKINNDSQIQIQ